MNDRTDQAADPELERLLDIIEQGYYEAGRFVRKGRLGSDGFVRAIGAHAALLAHIAEHYVRRDAYTAARGILPRKPGDELPEEAIRRLRDGDRQHTLYLDDAGNVAGGVGDFEGQR